ncbi:hypothetical protein DUI87_18413 [Hirundo rustica rustica]|uniref:RRM domain-containing protein n=1 Tax=Hirundo rustica rustica TaxID=333673 RepID=A0A3M0JWI6_HIRRU|nr:hypothetical protein DUI87_18413 [Hirundo rustica rustica]
MAPPSPSTNSSNNSSNNSSGEQLSKTNLYIRGLPPGTTDQDLIKLCQPYGKIVSTKAILDKNTNQCKVNKPSGLFTNCWYETDQNKMHYPRNLPIKNPEDLIFDLIIIVITLVSWKHTGVYGNIFPVVIPGHDDSFEITYRSGKVINQAIFLAYALFLPTCKDLQLLNGYGFVDFDSPAAAQKAVASLKANGVQAQMAKIYGISLLKYRQFDALLKLWKRNQRQEICFVLMIDIK